MNIRSYKLLRIILVLALAVAPLRGAQAFAPAATPDAATAPCAEMQHDMPAIDHMTVMHDTTYETSHQCERDCDGSCCDGACSMGVQGQSAIMNTMGTLVGIDGMLLITTRPDAFPDRPFSPLFRPPVDLLS